jgi:hypothetical protein
VEDITQQVILSFKRAFMELRENSVTNDFGISESPMRKNKITISIHITLNETKQT